MRSPHTGSAPGRPAAPARVAGASSEARSRVDDSGMVLAEVAIAIPMLVAVAAMLAWAVSLVGAASVLSDAARQVARDLARGVPVEQAVGHTQATVPEAVIEVRGSEGIVVVVARREVSAPLLGGLTVPIEQSVAVPREWA